MSAPMPIARKIGGLLGADEIPEIKPIDTNHFRLRRTDIWPPEVLAEIKRIYAQDEEQSK